MLLILIHEHQDLICNDKKYQERSSLQTQVKVKTKGDKVKD